MEAIKLLLEHITKLFRWWIIVHPWEQGLRVRFGKKVKQLSAGIHFRIPYFDSCYVQTTRLRVIGHCPITITSKDGQTITVVLNIGYSITDINKLFNTLYHPEVTIANIASGFVSTFIAKNTAAEATPDKIETHLTEQMKGDQYGLKYEYTKIVGYAIAKTFRLIQDSQWSDTSFTLDKLA
jgi:regulator of protease activity HflC (stomatin/prohibitin superfamily)